MSKTWSERAVPSTDDGARKGLQHLSGYIFSPLIRLLLGVCQVTLAMVLPELSAPWLQLLSAPSQGQTLVRYCAKFGEHRTFTLVDGTRLQLNSASCATALYSPQMRVLQMTQAEPAEAILDVVPDAHRPFVIQTPNASIRVVGTRFGIYRRVVDSSTNDISTRVAVIDGRVLVTPGGPTSQQNPIPLTAGKQIEISAADTAGTSQDLTEFDLKRITAWTEGDIDIDGTVRDLLVELDRYQHVCFRITDPQILKLPVSGRLHSHEIDKAMDYLTALGIRSATEYDRSGQRTETLTRRGHTRTTAKCL